MRKSRFSEAEIIEVIRDFTSGTPANELADRVGVHPNTIRGWRVKYNDLGTRDLARLRHLESENTQMQRIIARQAIELDAARELLSQSAAPFRGEETR